LPSRFLGRSFDLGDLIDGCVELGELARDVGECALDLGSLPAAP
jgi:hypothetical protein